MPKIFLLIGVPVLSLLIGILIGGFVDLNEVTSNSNDPQKTETENRVESDCVPVAGLAKSADESLNNGLDVAKRYSKVVDDALKVDQDDKKAVKIIKNKQKFYDDEIHKQSLIIGIIGKDFNKMVKECLIEQSDEPKKQ